MIEAVSAYDKVNRPSHYVMSNGVEVIDVTENLNFNRGNAVKYLCRAGMKDDMVEDLNKAIWYAMRELKRIGGEMTVDVKQFGFEGVSKWQK